MAILNLNSSPLKQPENTTRFNLNVCSDITHLGSDSNELGNELCNIIGSDVGLAGPPILIDRERFFVALKDNSAWVVNTTTCEATLHVQLECFGWDTLDEDHPVTGFHRSRIGCENVIYLFNGINRDKFINLSRPEKQKTDGEFDCTKFDLHSQVSHPTISRQILNSGGNLEYGTYNFAVEFLTSNEDSIFISPVDINYTPVVYQNNEGALNISTNLPDIGGKPKSNQSIKLTITNVPEDAILARIVVFRHITGDGFTSDAHVVGNLIPVSSSTIEYTYRGFSTDNGDYLVDKNEYLKVNAVYQSSLNGLSVNNRLVRYNLKEVIRDYSNYQSFASKICSKYVVKEVSKDDPNIHLLNQTLLGGEIILPTITYVHKDGSVSNAYPLIGRGKIENDEVEVENTLEVKQISLEISNSSGQNNDVSFDYEFSELLPNTSIRINYSSQQSAIKPISSISGTIQHNFSNNNFLPTLDVIIDGEVFPLGFMQDKEYQISINNTTTEKWRLYDTSIKDTVPISGYTSSGEFGYYENGQTYSNPPNFCGSDYWGKDCNGNVLQDTPVRLFVVPDRSVEIHENDNNIFPIGIWFDSDTIEYPNDDVVGHYFGIVVVNQSNIEAKGIGFNGPLTADSDLPAQLGTFPRYNSNGNSSFYTQPVYYFVTANHMVGQSYSQGEYISNEGSWNINYQSNYNDYNSVFEGALPYDDLRLYVDQTINNGYVKDTVINKTVINNLYIPPRTAIENITNYSHSNEFNIVTLPSNYTEGTGIKYLSLKSGINSISNIWNIVSRRIGELNDNVSFRGDNFIAPLNIDNIPDISIYNNNFFQTITFQDTKVVGYGEVIKDFYIESKYNSYLRHNGSDNCNKNIQSKNDYFNLFFNKIAENYLNKFKIKDSICLFFGGYNQDYSYVQDLNRYSSIRFTFDFCSKCSGEFPYRLVFSPQSFSDDLADGYRLLRPNDYVDIPSDTGAIIAVDYKDNKLVIRTERSCYFLQPNPQQMETSESNVYIGTGDFLSIPPQELNVTQEGYGGQQHKLDSINCNKGLIWSDRQRGEIYHLGGKFEQLEKPMVKWFKDNLKLNHLIMTYDPYYDRLIVTCKNNWTLSYCFVEQGWKSWHSYIPDYYCHDAETFYSFSTGYGMWKHNSNESNYTTYYGLEFPHIVELILNEGNTFNLQSLIYHSNVYSYANGYEEDVLGITYDQMIAYNDRQSTGLQNLVLDSEMNIYPVANQTHVKRTDRNFKVGQFKDFASSSNIWSTNISSIKQGVHGYMDKLPVVNFNINEVEMADFKSKWVGARLIFNQHDKKITLEFEQSNKQPSKR